MVDIIVGFLMIWDNILCFVWKFFVVLYIFGWLGLLLGNMNVDFDNIVWLVVVDLGFIGCVICMSNSVFYCGDELVCLFDEVVNCVGFCEMYKMVGVVMSE